MLIKTIFLGKIVNKNWGGATENAMHGDARSAFPSTRKKLTDENQYKLLNLFLNKCPNDIYSYFQFKTISEQCYEHLKRNEKISLTQSFPTAKKNVFSKK